MENHRLHAKYVFLQVPICDAQLQIVDSKWVFALFIWRQFMEFFQKMYQDDWTARKKKKYSKKLIFRRIEIRNEGKSAAVNFVWQKG